MDDTCGSTMLLFIVNASFLETSYPLLTFANYVDNNSTPTIASNLLEANAVLSWQGSCQSAKRLEPLLCATIRHTPPVMRDNSCYRRHTCSRVASVHMCTRGRDQPVILGAQTAQPRELQRVGEQPGLSTLHTSRLLHMPQSALADTELRSGCLHNYQSR